MSKYVINKSTLTDIGDAIREKTGKTELIPVPELADEIKSIETSWLPEVITLNGGHYPELFSDSKFSMFLENCPERLNFEAAIDATNMFRFSWELEDLSGLSFYCIGASVIGMFRDCYRLTKLPHITGKLNGIEYLFYGCSHLPSEEINKFFENLTPYTNLVTYDRLNYLFYRVNRARDLTPAFDWLQNYIENSKSKTHFVESPYYNMLGYNYILDKVVNMPVYYANSTANFDPFSLGGGGLSSGSYRASDFMFRTKEDGTPYNANWKNFIVDCAEHGYAPKASNIVDYGIGEDKRVTDATTYEALKNDPDWWTTLPAYSRYNHDSAVRTINSLPDTSAYLANYSNYDNPPINTVEFKGAEGELTDGGAVNTLTEEEIAVAANKGWTVTYI